MTAFLCRALAAPRRFLTPRCPHGATGCTICNPCEGCEEDRVL